ncbi:MAG: TraR/DksA family transcriptional regulator [Myxococcales bacterium]|nr:TraR/DksA family transcriptional regulator [Myxococcales bacterium]
MLTRTDRAGAGRATRGGGFDISGNADDWKAALGERLRARDRVLSERLGRVEADRRKTDGPVDPDFEEQAVERENDEVLDALGEAERSELTSIRRALERLDAGDFGVCDACGEDVEPGRLEALPEAAYCLACAEANEARER